jgi:hypothetical protein
MRRLLLIVLLLWNAKLMSAQVGSGEAGASTIPTIIKFNGTIRDPEGNAISGSQTVTFCFYAARNGGAPVWSETQSLTLDAQGRYSVYLGSATSSTGVPQQLFTSGQTQWIGVTPSDGVERPRIPLTTAPYAFKAADADTIGGMRPEDFVSVQQLNALIGIGNGKPPSTIALLPGSPSGQLATGVQTVDADLLRGFSDQAFAKLKFANTFDQPQVLAGGVILPPAEAETAQDGFLDSAPLDFESSIVQPKPAAPLVQTFRWISEPSVSSSGHPGARLSLLYGQNPNAPSPTGLSINSDGTLNFAANQVLPPAAVMQAVTSAQNESSAGTNGGYQAPTVNTALYKFTETPPGSTILAGPNVITLAPCPRGVNGTDQWHYLYVSQTGTPEAVLITGGTCTSGANTGTIEFTAQYVHPPGYSIASSTDGVQEGIITAAGNSGIARNVTIDPGSHVFHARLSVRANSITITASGASITCAMSDTCVMLGDPGDSNEFNQIVLNGLRLAAGVPSGTWTAIEDNGEGSQINNFAPATSSVSGASFGSLIQIDNDQAGVITGMNTGIAVWSRCDMSFCSTAIVGAGKNNDAGLFSLEDSELNLNCTANGIDNQNGNTMSVSNTEIQAYPQFGVRSRSTYSDVTNVQFNKVYEEIGNCVNPLGTGMAGLIVENGSASVTAGAGPNGELPQFANTGTTQYNYSIVVHSSIMGTSPAYLAGNAMTSGTGAIPVRWNQIGNTGVVTYDVLRTAGLEAAAPFGTGPFAVATAVPASSCSNKVCTFVDDASAQPTTYAVSTDTNYWPALTLWPGNVILTTAWDYQNMGGGIPTFYTTDVLNSGTITNSAGAYAPSVSAQVCNPQLTTSLWVQCNVGAGTPVVTATVLQLYNVGGLKGREIYEITPAIEIGATEIDTWGDANPAKTMASQNNRPSWDANDTYVAYDQPSPVPPSSFQLAFGAPTSITNYTGSLPDNVHWGERLTPIAKIFKVPVQANNNLTVDGTLTVNGSCAGNGCGPYSASGTQVSDAFTEANSGTLGSNWITVDGTCSIVNGQALLSIGADGRAFCVYTGPAGTTFAGNQYVIAQVTTLTTGTASIGARTSSTAETGYYLQCNTTNSQFTKAESGQLSQIGGYGPPCATGDYLRFSVSGASLTGYDITQGWTLSATDSGTPITSGFPGLMAYNSSGPTFANFSAGNLSYSANAAVSSLSSQDIPNTYLSFGPCNLGMMGTRVTMVDSTTNVLGETIGGGGGSYGVGAFCDGINWTVYAK